MYFNSQEQIIPFSDEILAFRALASGVTGTSTEAGAIDGILQ